MINFSELKIDKNNQGFILYVAAEILPELVGKGVYIRGIDIGTQRNYNPYTEGFSETENIYTNILINPENITTYKWCISEQELRSQNPKFDLEKDLLFVKVYTYGTPEPVVDLPCGQDKASRVGVAFNRELIYRICLDMLNHVDVCNPDLNFMNSVNMYNALKLSLESGNFALAMEYWDNFTRCGNITDTYILSNCNSCNNGKSR